MDETADLSALPVDFEGSLDPSRLPEVTLGNHTLMEISEQSTPLITKTGSDRVSPVRGRTMKEYDQQISDLKKENFSLKMRIYYMEERMQQRYGDGQDVFKTNIELQVEIENLKRELSDKQVLVQKAALAMETLTAKHEQEEESIKNRILADYKKEMEYLRSQLDKVNQDCDRSHKDVEDAERKMEVLKKQLFDARTELANSHRTKEDLTARVKNTEFDVESLTGQLKLAEQAKTKLEKENITLSQKLKDFEDQLHDARRVSMRKDRDINNLSALLQDQSHVDCTPILESVHIQDELEDQKLALAKKDRQIVDLEGELKNKDSIIGSLESTVKDLEEKQKNAEKALGEMDSDLGRKNMQLDRYKKSIEGLVKSLQQKDEECKDQKKKLEEASEDVGHLQESLREMELLKTKELSNVTSQLAEADANSRRLMHQLAEANETSENLVKSLGKKEGELAGFQDKLSKAMDALEKSEEAVEALHTQLKSERAEFDNRLREQAVHFQISVNNKSETSSELEGLRQQIVDLQKLIACQNVELLGLARERYAVEDLQDRLKEKDKDIELMSSEHKRELAELEQELQALKAEVSSKDLQVQALENHKVWLEEQQRETIQRLRETWSSAGGINIQDFSFDLLQDIKMLMDLLRREISSLATLQLQQRELNKSEHGVSSEILTTEISSVQRIYKQLEEGVEKNSRLHQVLLNSFRGEFRQSDSPDSNSCQDGGYNLGSTQHQGKHTRLSASPDVKHGESRSTQQKSSKTGKAALQSESLSSLESELSSPPVSQSAAVETCPELTDRSMQTGTSFSHTDQWVQTSPRIGGNEAEEVLLGMRGWRGSGLGQEVHDALPVPAGLRPLNKSTLPFFADSDDDIRHHYIFGHHNDSLTDDAKELAESLEDYHNFQNGVFFEEGHMDFHRSDQGSSLKHDSKQIASSGRILSKAGSNNASRSGDEASHLLHRNVDTSPQLSAQLTKVTNDNGIVYHENSLAVDEPDGSCAMLISNTSFGSGSFGNNAGSRSFNRENPNPDLMNNNGSMNLKMSRVGSSGRDEGIDCNDGMPLKTGLPSDIHLIRSMVDSSLDDGIVDKQKEHSKEVTKVEWEKEHSLEDSERREEKGRSNLPQVPGNAVRSRRNSWAEELEQYRVENDKQEQSPDKTESTQQSQDNYQMAHYLSRLKQNSADHQPKPLAAMSPSELRSLVTELQIDLVGAVTQNQELQKELAEVNDSLDEQRRTDPEAGTHKSCTEDYHKSSGYSHNKNQKSRIPRPRFCSSNGHSSIIGSCANITYENTDEDRRLRDPTDSHIFGDCVNTDTDKTVNTSAHRTDGEELQGKLSQSYDQIKELEEKLLASERTVQLLSTRQENYLSALEAAGISVFQMNRSNSEMCLNSFSKSVGTRTSSGGNFSPWISVDDCHDRLARLVSSSRDSNSSNITHYPGVVESMERARSRFPGTYSQSDNDIGLSQLTSIVETSASSIKSPDSTTRNSENVDCLTQLGEKISPDYRNSSLPDSVSCLSHKNIPISNLQRDQSSSPVLKNPEASGMVNLKYGKGTSPDQDIQQNNVFSDRPMKENCSHILPEQSSPPKAISKGFPADSLSCLDGTKQTSNGSPDTGDHKSPGRHVRFSLGHSNAKLYMDASVMDQSGYPDVTYSSMLDSTMMNRLISNLEHNLSTVREDALNVSSLNMEQLQIRVEHLERVNLTLREEIGVYEALHRSQSTQVSPSLSEEFGGEGNGQGSGVTDEDLLKQHLIEIRKLRQRLERLDVTKDPDQLLIFQSHTQQRIARQEMMIVHLQQQMVEKEEQWQREMAEMQHKLSREKALLVEKLEMTISELNKTVKSQASKIKEQEKQIVDFISELNVKEEHERRKEEEMRKVINEKVELEADLLKRDKEFLDIEKNLFRLEMAKENSESKCKRLYSEIEEKDKENVKLRKQVEESKESSRGMRETVIKCERSLQDKVFILQKLTSEKASSDHRLTEKEVQVKKLEAELGSLRKEMNEMRVGLEEKVGLKAEIDTLREELKKKESLEAKYEFQKVGYETELERMTEEKIKLRAQLESKNEEKAELKHKIDQLEHKLMGKAALESQIFSLKEEIKSLSGLRSELDRLSSELDTKTILVAELRERLTSLCHLPSEVSALREKLLSAEEGTRLAEESKKRLMIDLKEREEKVKKRDKQLHHLLGQYKKLDAAFTKQKYSLTEKLELVQSLKKQMHLYEVALTCASQEEKDNMMKQLLKELIATQRQVEELLSRLEQNSAAAAFKPPSVLMDTFNFTSSSVGKTTTVTTTTTKGSSHDDIPGVTQTTTVRDDSPERSYDELSHDMDQELRPHTALTPISTNHLSSRHSVLSSQGTSPSRTPRRLKYFADSDDAMPKAGNIPECMIGSDIRTLFAVLKLDSHEKLRKETGESLVTLSGLEARLGSRLRMYKSKSVSESLEYSTLREASMSCQNLRMCLEEATRLIATAWITELPPIDSQGHFYDPVLAEQNENLKHELALLYARYDRLDDSLNEQEGSRLWESSLYKQLHKTTKDLEQAKENIDTSLAELPSPRKYQSFSQYSPHKSPRRRLEDTF